jgi:hypothetical protein
MRLRCAGFPHDLHANHLGGSPLDLAVSTHKVPSHMDRELLLQTRLRSLAHENANNNGTFAIPAAIERKKSDFKNRL